MNALVASPDSLSQPTPGPILQCQSGYVYSMQSDGTVVQVAPGGGTSTFGGNGWSGLNINSANGLGISAGGATMYGYNRTGGNSQNVGAILQYTQSTNSWIAIPNSSYSTGISSSLVTGAVDLATGNYLYGGYNYSSSAGQYQFVLFQFNTTTSVNSTVGYFNTGITNGGTNGDMAFDSAGNLFIVASGSSTSIFTVTASALSAALASPGSSTVIAKTGGNQGSVNISNVNGIAFDADGTVYLGNGSTLQHYNPTTWAQIGGNVTSSLGNSTDLASCNSPASLTIQKNLPNGRAATADQFTLTATYQNTTLGTVTTDGPATGVQTKVLTVPAVTNLTYNFSEAMASGSSSALSAYTTTWACTGATASGSGTSGSVTIPAGSGSQGAQVVCTFTNTPKSATVNLNKTWLGGTSGDTAGLTISGPGVTGATGATSIATGANPQADTAHTATASAAYGSTVTVSETLSNPQYTAAFVCTQGTTPVATTPASATSATFTMPSTGNVNCVVTNTPLRNKVTLTKTWLGSTSGDTAALTITGPQVVNPVGKTSTANGSNPQKDTANAATANAGYGSTVTIAEALTAHGSTYTTAYTCTQGSTSLTTTPVSGATKATFTMPTTAGDVTCVITNTPVQTMTLVKKIGYGSAAATAWTISATPPTGTPISGATGSAAVTNQPVTGGTTYALAESGGLATYTATPAGWQCVTGSGGPGTVPVTDGAVTVPYGQSLTCTITNSTAKLTLLKNTDQSSGGLQPGWFTITGTPSPMTGLSASSVTGADLNPATDNLTSETFEVRPGWNYTLSEAIDSSHNKVPWMQTQLQQWNGTAWVDVSSNTVSVAQGSNAIYRYVNLPIPALALPLTGGVGTDLFLVMGGLVILAALGAGLWYRRRITPPEGA